jgi:hypothetical protein
MSALPLEADIERHDCMSALCQKRTNAPQQKALLFDHLVGRGQQTQRHFKAERPAGQPAQKAR